VTGDERAPHVHGRHGDELADPPGHDGTLPAAGGGGSPRETGPGHLGDDDSCFPCYHGRPCPVCRICLTGWPHEPGTWPIGEPIRGGCRDALILHSLDELDEVERLAVQGLQALDPDDRDGGVGDGLRQAIASAQAERDKILGVGG
jgi:hypothetical protein